LRHPADNGARLRQRIQDNVKGRFCFRGLAEARIVQNHQKAEADQTSFHGKYPSTAIIQSSEIKFRPEPRVPCPKTIRSPGRFRHRRVQYHLDKKAIDAQLPDLFS
jgi:hypothetical protein